MKRCGSCREMKSFEDFAPNPKNKDGRHGYCRPCAAAYMREWRQTHKVVLAVRDRKKHLKRSYNLTPEKYAEMLEAQGGQCALCGRVPDYRLAVDHDHRTGEIRGLLCNKCNTGIGYFDDDLEVIRRLAVYLGDKHEALA